MFFPVPESSGLAKHWHRLVHAVTHIGLCPVRPVVNRFAPAQRSDRIETLNLDPDEVIVLVGPQLGRARDWIQDQHFAVLNVTSLPMICSQEISGLRISHVIVDIDYFGGIWEVFDELRRIRNTLPEIAVVLVSREFSQDDFRCERLALCDASIRAPFSLASLEFALTEAGNVNNPIWQKRLRELQAAEALTPPAQSA